MPRPPSSLLAPARRWLARGLRALGLAAACAGLATLPAGSRAATRAGGDAPGHLSVSGGDILGPDGRPILLRGWNWGHWGKAQERDAADNVAQGANVVRIPLRWWGYYQGKDIDSRDDRATATAGIDPAHLKMLDDYVRWASREKLWIVLFIDSNCGQNGEQNGKMVQYCDPDGQYKGQPHNFFTDKAARQRFIDVWRFVARRYKDTPYLGMFEPLPEPGAKDTSPRDITQFYDEVMAAIRQVAPGIPFLIGPHTYKADRVREAYNPAWKDVIYTGNLFLHAGKGAEAGSGNLRTRMQALVALRSQQKVPVFVQQVGVRSGDDPDLTALRTVLDDLVQNRIGYTYWEYRGASNPGEYGVLFQNGSEWQAKTNVLNAISASFRK